MYKVIRIEGNKVYIGNTVDNSFKKLLLENAYEGIKIGDIVDVYGDGNTLIVVKNDKNIKSLLSESSQTLSTFKFEKLNADSFLKTIKHCVIEFFKRFKYGETYGFLGIYLGVIYAIVVVVTMVIKQNLTMLIQSGLGEYGEYLINPQVSISPNWVLANVMLSDLSISVRLGDFFGGTTNTYGNLMFSMPIILLSIISISTGMLVLKWFIRSNNYANNSRTLLVELISTAILGQLVVAIGLFLFVRSISLSDALYVSANISVLNILKGIILATIIALIFGYVSDETKSQSSYLMILSIFRQKVILHFVVGVLGSVMVFMLTTWDSVILIGNYAFLLMAVSLGASVTSNMNGQIESISDFIPNFTPVLILITGVSIIVMIIDLDDIYSGFRNINKYLFSVFYGLATFLTVSIVASLATISMNLTFLGVTQSMKLGIDFGAFTFGLLITCGFCAVRLSFPQHIPLVDYIKNYYSKTMARIGL